MTCRLPAPPPASESEAIKTIREEIARDDEGARQERLTEARSIVDKVKRLAAEEQAERERQRDAEFLQLSEAERELLRRYAAKRGIPLPAALKGDER